MSGNFIYISDFVKATLRGLYWSKWHEIIFEIFQKSDPCNLHIFILHLLKKEDNSSSGSFTLVYCFTYQNLIISGNAKWLICHYTQKQNIQSFSFGSWLPLMSNPSHLATAHTNSKALSCTKTHHTTHMHTLHEAEGPCSLATSCCNCCNRSTLVWLL